MLNSISTLGETRPEQEWSNGTEFSGYSDFPEKRVQSKRIPKFTVPFNFGPEISEFFAEWKAPHICMYSRLRLNSITVFSSTSTRFGISSRRDLSGCVELPQRLQLEINCIKGKKKQRRSNQFELGRCISALKSFLLLLLLLFATTYV